MSARDCSHLQLRPDYGCHNLATGLLSASMSLAQAVSQLDVGIWFAFTAAVMRLELFTGL